MDAARSGWGSGERGWSLAGRVTTAFVVGITGEGGVTLTEEPYGAQRRPLISLPMLAVDRSAPVDGRLAGLLRARFRDEFGCEAPELIPMKSGFGGGGLPGSRFFLAPLARRGRASSQSLHVVREVPLGEAREHLAQRQREGARVEPHVRQGLLLAEELFPRWARERLGRALGAIGGRHNS